MILVDPKELSSVAAKTSIAAQDSTNYVSRAPHEEVYYLIVLVRLGGSLRRRAQLLKSKAAKSYKPSASALFNLNRRSLPGSSTTSLWLRLLLAKKTCSISIRAHWNARDERTPPLRIIHRPLEIGCPSDPADLHTSTAAVDGEREREALVKFCVLSIHKLAA
jgi:hypothetical protein